MNQIDQLAKKHGWSAVEKEHAEDNIGIEYGVECVIPLQNGKEIHCPAFPDECSYVRVVQEGCELGYWNADEWGEAPTEVMGAILGLLRSGTTPVEQASPAPILDESAEVKYLFDVASRAKPGASTISDIRLALSLKHDKHHAQTYLLTVTADGQKYALMLGGYVEGYDHQADKEFDSENFTEELIDQLELPVDSRNEQLEVAHGPWFEWIDADGTTVGDVFDEVPLDPNLAVADLMRILTASPQ